MKNYFTRFIAQYSTYERYCITKKNLQNIECSLIPSPNNFLNSARITFVVRGGTRGRQFATQQYIPARLSNKITASCFDVVCYILEHHWCTSLLKVYSVRSQRSLVWTSLLLSSSPERLGHSSRAYLLSFVESYTLVEGRTRYLR